MKAFRFINLSAMILTLAVAAASLVGIMVTGFYPGIIVLLLLTLIPVVTNFYTRKLTGNPADSQATFLRVFTMINALIILVVLWMTFVILVDRVFGSV